MLIDTRLAERLKKINPSSTLAITAKAKKLKSQGQDVITLAAGEPDFDTPEFVKNSAIEAIKSGFTKYTPSTGTPELKKIISERFQKDNHLDYTWEQIVVSCGAKHSIYNALMVLVNKHDEVILASPYWVSYPEMVNLCDGIARFVDTKPENDFKITADGLKRLISKKTKVLILNSPSNPAGSVYDEKELVEIAKICVKHKIFVISDEIYEKIIFDGRRHISIGSLDNNIRDLTITVNGLSKSYSMTGWRVGYLGAPLYIAEAIAKLQDHSTSNPNSIAQKAALTALQSDDSFPKQMCLEFEKRRDYLVSRLKGNPKIKYVLPRGAFYMFCDISSTKMDADVFAARLLEEALVAVIPGSGFGRKDYIRISFASSLKSLETAMDRIDEWMKKI